MPIKTPFQNIVDLENCLAYLLRDVHEIHLHGQPRPSSLKSAPRIEEWSHSALFRPCLVGRVTGHPLLADQPRIRTSQLIVVDAEAGWARTRSRFYRLGSPDKSER
jgi:hypothetical protein